MENIELNDYLELIAHLPKDAYTRMFAESKNKPIVSIEEEQQLILRIQRGGEEDENAKLMLLCAYCCFIYSVSSEYEGRGLMRSELIKAGHRGLIKAAEKYDASHGFKFMSYAVWWVRHYMAKAIDERLGGKPAGETAGTVVEPVGDAAEMEAGEPLVMEYNAQERTKNKMQEMQKNKITRKKNPSRELQKIYDKVDKYNKTASRLDFPLIEYDYRTLLLSPFRGKVDMGGEGFFSNLWYIICYVYMGWRWDRVQAYKNRFL